MSYTDVTNPVVINVTKATTFSVDNHLRRMALISRGNTSLAVGEYKEVDSSSYADLVTANTETYTQALTFFSYAGSKSLVILEVGDGSLESSVNVIKTFIDNESLKVFNIIVPRHFYNTDPDPLVYNLVINEQTLIPTEAAQTVNVTAELGFGENDLTFVFSDETEGEKLEFDIQTWSYKLKDAADPLTTEVTVTISSTALGKTVGTLVFNMANGTTGSSISFYESVKQPADMSFVNLLTELNDIDHEQLFFMGYPLNDPSIDTQLNFFKDMKSLQLVSLNSTRETITPEAAIVGITASNIFDISTSNPATALNYKAVKTYSPEMFTKTMKKSLIDASITFIDTLAGQSVVLNGRQMDGQPWDYYYYWYLTKFELDSKITTLLLNGANNPVSAINFNQDGIDTIHTVIVAKLTELQNMGVITDFAQSYDSNTGEFTGQGDITCVDYYTFIVNSPEDYQNEIYSGVSFYVQIGKFIRQVVMNVNIGA